MLTKTLLPSVLKDSVKTLDTYSGFDELGRVFATDCFTPFSNYPELNLSSTDDEAMVTADLPGFEPAAVDLSVEGSTLRLRGTREKEASENDDTYYRCERWSGSFDRTIRLPFEVEANKVEAKFNNGELKVTLPRAEADRPQKIEVKAA